MIARSPFKSPQQILSSPEDSSYPQDWGELVKLLKSEKKSFKYLLSNFKRIGGTQN